jgi:peroxin-4
MGYFMVRITVPAEYPSVPPKMSFLTPIIHPNIHIKTGEVCLDVLKDQWTPIWSLESACRAVIAMLGMPEADSPLNCDAGNMIRAGDLRGYASLAYMVTIEYASDVDAAKNRFFSSALLDLKFA